MSRSLDADDSWDDHPALEPLEPIDLATATIPPYDRPWLIQDWLPMLETVALGGPGGKGKTLLAQMLATAAALGSSWLGLPVSQMKSALLFCEDRRNDWLWRQRAINQYYNCTLNSLDPWILVLPRREATDNILASFDRDGIMDHTPFFLQLLAKLKSFAGAQPLLTVLDTRADVFWGDQNDERHARAFVRKVCDRIARETNGITCLIYQPSLTGIRDGIGTSGSVQWDAAVRARIYLKSPEAATDPSQRSLSLLKANYAEPDKTLNLAWKGGVFLRDEEATPDTPAFATAALSAKAERIFLKLLDDFTARGRAVSDRKAGNYAPRLFSQHQAAENLKQPALEAAMNSLFARGAIRQTQHRNRDQIVRTPEEKS